MSPLFFISRSRSLSPFFSLSFAGLPPTLSFSLSSSCSIFQICGHDNYSKINTLDNTDTETIFAFSFRLYWLLLSLLYKTPVAMRFPAKITSSCIWVVIPVDWVNLHWYTCGEDGRSGGRAGGRAYGHVITKFSRMGRLLHFLTHGAPLRALRAREFRYKQQRWWTISLEYASLDFYRTQCLSTMQPASSVLQLFIDLPTNQLHLMPLGLLSNPR